ncbi:MAG: hypothetical protein AMJ53_11940 [Gammaproteobacteria bacterium SG8_11]|nr:MAG: hypothetical protein AMJ53_11940 [Gammaproteobacteria bacterium SG8_11]
MKIINVRMYIVTTAFLMLSACVSYQATYDYDPEYNFSALKTYSWISDPTVSAEAELVEKHLRKAVDSKLTEMGYTSTIQDPDFLISMFLGRQNKTELTPMGYSYGAWYGGVNVYQYEEGTLVFDLVDAKQQHLIYRGVVRTEIKHNITFEERQERIKKAVDKIFQYFPPEKK